MKQSNKKFINILFRTMVTSLGAVAEIIAIFLILNKSLDLNILFLVGLITFLIYMTDFTREYSNQIRRAQVMILYTALLITLTLLIWTIFTINNPLIVISSIVLLLLGSLYDPFFKKITKIITGFKDYFVVFCCDFFVLSILIASSINAWSILFVMLFIVSRDFINITYCDIKDISPDEQNSLKTLASQIGINHLISIQIIVSIISVLVITTGIILGAIPKEGFFLFLPVLITGVLVLISHKNKTYSASNVDFEYYGWLFFAYLGKLII